MIKDPVKWGHRLLDVAIRRYKPGAVFGMFSGGHDSICATHMVSQHPAFTGAMHINTGIGIEQTREFVRDTCQTFDWPLFEYKEEKAKNAGVHCVWGTKPPKKSKTSPDQLEFMPLCKDCTENLK